MSLSTTDLTDLMELWEDLNLTSDPSNQTRVELLICSGSVGHAALLHVLSVLYILIFLVGLVANALVIWVTLHCQRLETDLYILNLAAADLFVVATLPVWVSSLLRGGLWPFGEAVCKLAHMVFSINLFSSIFFLACMSVDRYLSVSLLAKTPDGRRKMMLRRLVCILVWLVALAASVPEFYFLQAVKSAHHDGAVCRPVFPSTNPRNWMVAVQLSFFVLGFAVPFPIIAVFYLLLAAAIGPAADQERHVGRRLVLSYILVFLVCWLPFHGVLLLDTLTLLHILPFTCRLETFLDVALHLTQGMSLLHCCINPVLYNLLSRSHRYHLMKAFIFKYSTKTGLARLVDASETEYSAMDNSGGPAGGLLKETPQNS
ncbi:atypical chemokine receptor 3-like [Melanotaenia boesemani]|uniref:atypical chemokine receptor 3-like n=1 Tax=Melanotaenia boesemani TaxID=1250792 RepID=UPI001C056404|nr:atypical chemokine receptor 3-like [Melanotaenia boesemani]XP_041834775.1 atypical chemokine receptor 3-like [Melanotaenia boesemani]